jgi:methylmalonyl-CoA mutase C-terminal domain/subunit
VRPGAISPLVPFDRQAGCMAPAAAKKSNDSCLEEPKIQSLKVQDSETISPPNRLPLEDSGAVLFYLFVTTRMANVNQHEGTWIATQQIQEGGLPMEQKRIPRILVARPCLNGHDCNAMAFALAFRDASFEVIFTGGHQNPEQIVSTAIQEDVDMIALSILGSAHAFSFERILEMLKENGAGDIPVIRSSEFSLEGIPKMKEMGIEYPALSIAS